MIYWINGIVVIEAIRRIKVQTMEEIKVVENV